MQRPSVALEQLVDGVSVANLRLAEQLARFVLIRPH
jgi:hypothetical protein